MARMNVYLPDELAARARAAGLNVSAIFQTAIEDKLAGQATATWLAEVAQLPPTSVRHEDAMVALDATCAELGAER